MTPKKFSLIPGNISRFFILMVIVLLATMGVMIKAPSMRLKEKSYQVVDVSHALHQRIDAWRYATADLRQYRRHLSQHRKRRSAGDAFKTGRLLPGETPA